MLKHVKGDLLELARQGEFDVIVHGCNCFCTMGSGIARQVREEYPEAYEADKTTRSGDYNKLGNYTTAMSIPMNSDVKDEKFFVIVNAYTQYDFNRGGKNSDVFEYTSFAMILQKLANEFSGLNIGFPYIGMGLAGGDKETIVGMLEYFAEEIEATGGTVTLVEFQK